MFTTELHGADAQSMLPLKFAVLDGNILGHALQMQSSIASALGLLTLRSPDSKRPAG